MASGRKRIPTDALGRLQGTERSTPSGTAQALSFSYDARNLLTREAVVSGDETQSYTYAHDQLGRRKAKETNSAAGDLLQTYVYDRGNRLLSVTGGTSAVTRPGIRSGGRRTIIAVSSSPGV